MGRRPPRLPITAASLLNGSYRAATRGQIYADKLHWSITPGALFNYFGRFGKVDSVHIPYSMKTGQSRGFGWVLMANTDDVRIALEPKKHYIGDFSILVGPRRNKRDSPAQRISTLPVSSLASVDLGTSVDPPAQFSQELMTRGPQDDGYSKDDIEKLIDQGGEDATDELLEYATHHTDDLPHSVTNSETKHK